MATETTVITEEIPVENTSTENEVEEMEITTEWLESLLKENQREILSAVTLVMEALQTQSTLMTQIVEKISNMESQNLSQLITTQQETITGLVAQSMQTVQSLLVQQTQPVEVVTESQNVGVEDPAARTERAEPLLEVRPKRRKI